MNGAHLVNFRCENVRITIGGLALRDGQKSTYLF